MCQYLAVNQPFTVKWRKLNLLDNEPPSNLWTERHCLALKKKARIVLKLFRVQTLELRERYISGQIVTASWIQLIPTCVESLPKVTFCP